MQEKDSLLFALLRRALWGDNGGEQLPEGDWEHTIEALREHALLGVTADAMLSLPGEMRPDMVMQKNIMRHFGSLTQIHYTLNKAVCDVFRIMYDAGLRPILLKGQGLATLYPKQFTRSCGDIDVFLVPEDFDRGCELIYDYCGEQPSEFTEVDGKRTFLRPENNIHLTAHMGKDVKFEMHYLPASTAIADIKDEYNTWMTEMLRQCDTVSINGMDINVPRMQANVVYVFEHILKHMRTEGVGLRQFVDWMMLLHHAAGSIDHEQLRRDLTRFHLLDAWQVLGGIVVWQLGLPEKEFPLWSERKAKHSQGRNLEYILYAGNLGKKLGEYKEYYYMSPSMKRDILALRYAWHYQRFMYHVLPYDTPRRVWGDVVRTISQQLKRLF